MRKLSFLVFSEDPQVRARVEEELLATNQVKIQVTVTEEASLEAELRRVNLDGLYIDLDSDPDSVFEIVSRMQEPRPLLLFGGQHGDTQVLLRAMRLGAKDFFVGHKLDGLAAIIEKTVPRRDDGNRTAQVVAVVGAKGGVGATTIACELAVALQEAESRVLVCDLNLRLGDVPLYFDLQPGYSLADIAKKEGDLDDSFIDAVVAEHASAVSVLAAPVTFEDMSLINFGQLDRTLKFVQNDFDCVILDIPWGFDEFTLRTLDRCDQILLVTTADVPSLTHARSRIELMQRFGTAPEDVHVVLNRRSKQAAFDDAQVMEFLERELDCIIPDEPDASQQCMNEGKLLREARGGEAMRKAIRSLRNGVIDWCKLEEPVGEGLDDGIPFVSRIRKLVTRG